MAALGLTPANVLRGATHILNMFGLAKGAPYDPHTGAVDTIGALQLACGVHRSELTDDLFTAMVVVPQANLPGFADAWTALDATVDGVEEWQDDPATTVDDVIAVMVRVAEQYERRVIP